MDEVTWSIFGEICGTMVDSIEHPFCAQQPFHSYRATRVNSRCRYSNFRSKSKSVSVGKSRRGIVEDAGGIDLIFKVLGSRFVFRDDDICVGTAEAMNVCDCCVNILNDFDTTLKAAVLVLQGLCWWRSKCEALKGNSWELQQEEELRISYLIQFWARVDSDTLLLEHVADFVEKLRLLIVEKILVDEQSLHRIAR